MSEKQKTGLVVSAHAADFVWRAGGAIALYASRGWKVRIVCLSLGERGESAKMWREPGMTLEKVTEARLAESKAAAELLGGEFVNLGLQDYPMRVPDETLFRLADMFREIQPEWVLTHSLADPYNFDHPLAAHVTQEARIIAQAMGYRPDTKPIGAPPVFLFEPHQTEQSNWKPEVLLDITPVWEKKRKAFEIMAAQEYLWDYYTRVAINRGAQAARNSDMKDIKYAEAYQRVFPFVGREFA
ncbi:MAG: PIG-L family deacetylase [Betaproteobacteria bacterium]|nr:PIG-L family deacetylase [Betaproteobacteria bacterium]